VVLIAEREALKSGSGFSVNTDLSGEKAHAFFENSRAQESKVTPHNDQQINSIDLHIPQTLKKSKKIKVIQQIQHFLKTISKIQAIEISL
jgi:hypothetical protein